jgi:hypothetical protein
MMAVVVFEDHTEIYCTECGLAVSSSNGEFHAAEMTPQGPRLRLEGIKWQ